MIWQLLKRGMRRQCPQCGDSLLFDGYLTVRKACEKCGVHFQDIRADDMPAYFTIAVVGHLLLPLIYWAEVHCQWSLTVHLTVWLPLTIVLTLGLLPPIKGVAMAITWYTKKM